MSGQPDSRLWWTNVRPDSPAPCGGCGKNLLPGTRYSSDEQRGVLLCKACRGARTKANPNMPRVQHDWYLKNRDRVLAQQREYAAANREARAEYKRRWNQQGSRDYKAERVARIAGNGGVDKIQRRAVWGRDEGHCRIGVVCGGAFVPYVAMELDHIIPLSRGGTHTWDNVQTACRPCNRRKFNHMPDELAA